MENRRKRHRDCDSTDATLKQHYVENDLGPAECAERLNNNNNNNNQRFRWQEPPGKIICVLFCFDTRRDEEKETQNMNGVGTIHSGFRFSGLPAFPDFLVGSPRLGWIQTLFGLSA